ncbi:MAG: hypothetical protein ACPG4T_04930, partial [Nannocystaceae bacterium]
PENREQPEQLVQVSPQEQVEPPQPACLPGPPLDPSVVPEDARLVVWIDHRRETVRSDLEGLATKLDGQTEEFPIVVGLALGQLGIQHSLVRRVLEPLDLWPQEILWLHRSDGSAIWLWQARCDLDRTVAAGAKKWNLRARTTVEGRVMEPLRSPSGIVPDDPFPYDLVAIAGDRWLLAPAGSGTASARWLLEESSKNTADAEVEQQTPAAVLSGLTPGSVRAVASGGGLLLGAADRPGGGAMFTLRADKGTVEVNKSQPESTRPPP